MNFAGCINWKMNKKNHMDLPGKIGSRESRKLRARNREKNSLWLGFGMFGVVGWSVAIPTLLGAALGYWLDKHYPAHRSYTLILLIAGLSAGCLNAWFWLAKEKKAIQEEEENNHE